MRSTRNIRRPFRRYEKALETSLKMEEISESDMETPEVYADITASTGYLPTILKVTETGPTSEEQPKVEDKGPKSKKTKKSDA
jgi:hypothetical protein